MPRAQFEVKQEAQLQIFDWSPEINPIQVSDISKTLKSRLEEA